jgi:hypothetical protein
MEKSDLRHRAKKILKNSTNTERHLWYHCLPSPQPSPASKNLPLIKIPFAGEGGFLWISKFYLE